MFFILFYFTVLLRAKTTAHWIILHKCPVSGVPHGDDTLYMFPNIIAGTKLVTDEKHFHVTERLLRIVTNFAQNG
jgi:hypothetical protein